MVCPTVQNGGMAMKFGLHPPAGGFFGKVEAALQTQALEGRKLREDLLAIPDVDILENVDGVVAVEGRHAARDLIGRQFVHQVGTDVLVDLGQRLVVELVAQHLDELQPFVGLQCLKHVARVGGVEGLHHVGNVRLFAGQQMLAQAFDPQLIQVILGVTKRVWIEPGVAAVCNARILRSRRPLRLALRVSMQV